MKDFASKVEIEIDGRIAAIRFGKLKYGDDPMRGNQMLWGYGSKQIYSWKDDVDDISGESATGITHYTYGDLYENQQQMFHSLISRIFT